MSSRQTVVSGFAAYNCVAPSVKRGVSKLMRSHLLTIKNGSAKMISGSLNG
ncbi:MAG: hypothetical protein IJV35_08765 [Neisseriaceae bacterium]|nr:hypothetical protein [Neisseriaceae bacterium]